MERTERAGDLRDLLRLSKDHSKLQIFVDDPPIILEPSTSKHTTTFDDPKLVQLFADNYYNEHGWIGANKLCMCMSAGGRFVYVLSCSHFIVIDLFSRKVSEINQCNPWPFTTDSDLKSWHLKVEGSYVFLTDNTAGSFYFLELDLPNNSIGFKAEFHFDATKKKLYMPMVPPLQVAKRRIIQMNDQHLLILLRNDEDLPELELYSLFDFTHPLRTFKNIPNAESLHGCIKLDGCSIYVLNITFGGQLLDLTIIDIESGQRDRIPFNVEWFSMGVHFLIEGLRRFNFTDIISLLEDDTNFEYTMREAFRQCFGGDLTCSLDYYINGKILLIFYIDTGYKTSGYPSVLISRLNMETGEHLRTIFDWPDAKYNNIFKSHFISDREGRLRLLKVGIGQDKVSFQVTTTRGGGVESLRQLSLLAVKCLHPQFLENHHDLSVYRLY